jgi:iron complex transport system substrate-binding protein
MDCIARWESGEHLWRVRINVCSFMLRSMRIVSLLPAATEIAAALGLMEEVVGVSHECDYPVEANERSRVTHCPVHHAGLASAEVDEWVRRALHDNGTIYTIDEALLRELRPDVILTQKLCDVCAVS